MKKLICVLLAVCFLMLIVGCGEYSQKPPMEIQENSTLIIGDVMTGELFKTENQEIIETLVRQYEKAYRRNRGSDCCPGEEPIYHLYFYSEGFLYDIIDYYEEWGDEKTTAEIRNTCGNMQNVNAYVLECHDSDSHNRFAEDMEKEYGCSVLVPNIEKGLRPYITLTYDYDNKDGKYEDDFFTDPSQKAELGQYECDDGFSPVFEYLEQRSLIYEQTGINCGSATFSEKLVSFSRGTKIYLTRVLTQEEQDELLEIWKAQIETPPYFLNEKISKTNENGFNYQEIYLVLLLSEKELSKEEKNSMFESYSTNETDHSWVDRVVWDSFFRM